MALKKRARNNKGILLLAFLVFAVVLGALVFRKYETATHKVEPAPAAAPVGTVVATLFFASADGQGLVREGREVEVEETVKGDVAQIDFGREFSEAIPHGSSAEMAAVYSIVDTVSTNFPAIKSVRFLVEGQPVSDPDGHLDLTAPLPADYSLEKKPQPS
jgi:hypothetical protein